MFGGTGFLGNRIVRHLCSHEFSVRIASRHPDVQPQSVAANIHDERSVANALVGAYGAVNAVSLYRERGGETFHSVHVEAAQLVAAQARRAGVERLVHVSGIGADAASPSLYIRKRGEGERAVRAEFADAFIVRPAVMFGPDDAFLNTVLKLLRRLPIYPMFGRGRTRLQPAYVEDVAEAVARIMERAETYPTVFEFGGPTSYSYEQLLGAIAHQAGLAPLLIPMPFAVWQALAWAFEILPRPPLTRNQVELMRIDSVSSPEMPGFSELGISPHSIEEILRRMSSHRG
ncbi:complex I NDUFA9 subunit family protein [Bradyrhizobium sp. SSUT77]|uniref:complex I NDUFA9 subunit family protein n=1 Tax=Bradyrhizobium sp. SSUT77 TaxID=3040603 RepID=UPI002446B8C5|nr:complex I NDUFA9 subunit family protein [Bradyrhizobium sp. SSUT77]MDH2341868.1 complex I NDUFA9 subunit family protein [Bradyrhizobium sp. SSUT77]